MRFWACLLPLLPLGVGCAGVGPWKKPVEQDLTELRDVRAEEQGLLGGLSQRTLKRQVRTAMGKGPDKEVARQLLVEGERQYREAAALNQAKDLAGARRMFLSAAAKYNEAALRWPDSAVEEDAMFMAGDSLFFADHYDDANQRFEELLKKYPNSRHLDRAEGRRFSIARYWEQKNAASPEPVYYMNFTNEERPFRDATGNALRVYDKIRIDDPTGRLADDATMAAANLHFEKGNYIQADEYYDDLRRTFPNSEHQFMAHFLGLRTKLAAYQGVDYSGTVLHQANDLIRKMETLFPRESKEHAEYLARASAEIKYLQAEREWNDAQYYDRRSEFGAARFHYDRLVKQFPSTPLAEKAQSRLENIRGLPEVPEQKLEWLVNLFPREAEPKLKMLDEGQDATAIARQPGDARAGVSR